MHDNKEIKLTPANYRKFKKELAGLGYEYSRTKGWIYWNDDTDRITVKTVENGNKVVEMSLDTWLSLIGAGCGEDWQRYSNPLRSPESQTFAEDSIPKPEDYEFLDDDGDELEELAMPSMDYVELIRELQGGAAGDWFLEKADGFHFWDCSGGPRFWAKRAAVSDWVLLAPGYFLDSMNLR